MGGLCDDVELGFCFFDGDLFVYFDVCVGGEEVSEDLLGMVLVIWLCCGVCG